MKRVKITNDRSCMILASAVALLFATNNAYGQDAEKTYEVSTSVTPKNILVEDYTGINCGNCPDADLITEGMLKTDYNIFVLSNHSGYYAEPSGTEPDYRTDEGEIIKDYFNVTSFPTGSINRRAFSGTSVICDRGNWINYSKIIAAEDAPVNLFLSCTYDGNTREMDIHVEGYYTAEEQESDQELNVIWTQSNIKGYQGGSSLGTDYIHNNVLRGFLTPVWGDTLTTPKHGEYFEKDYTLIVPESIRDIDVMPEDIRVIAFITNGKTDVLNVVGEKPVYYNFEKPLAGTIAKPKLTIGTYYGYKYFELALTNNSTEVINNATFNINVNGTSYQESWEGEIVPFGSKEIVVPCDYELKDSGDNSYSITLATLNGEAVEESTIEGTFSTPTAATPTINISITTNKQADENHYYVKDNNGNIITEFGPYEVGTSNDYTETVDLEANNLYCIEITDDWGDGIYTPRGSVTAKSSDGSLISQVFDISGFGTRIFFITSKESSGIKIIKDNLLDGTHDIEVYNWAGIKMFSGKASDINLPVGTYIFRDKTEGTATKIIFK